MEYGKELMLDMGGCDTTKFNRADIRLYFKRLCELIDMIPEKVAFWDDLNVPVERRQTNPKTKGTTAIQFILTSNITIHTLDLLGAVLINIFSCEEYDIELVKDFTVGFFGAKNHDSLLIERELL